MASPVHTAKRNANNLIKRLLAFFICVFCQLFVNLNYELITNQSFCYYFSFDIFYCKGMR